MANRQPTCISLQQKRCVYCQQAFEPSERSLAGTTTQSPLFPNMGSQYLVLGSSSYTGFTDVFEMPSIGLMNQRYVLVYFTQRDAAQQCALCLRPACYSCKSSPSSYLAHKDCLDIRTNIVPGKATCKEVWHIRVAANA